MSERNNSRKRPELENSPHYAWIICEANSHPLACFRAPADEHRASKSSQHSLRTLLRTKAQVPTPAMQTSLPASARRPRAWNRSTHACSDGAIVHRRLETTVINVIDKLERKISHTAQRSGVWLKFGLPLVVDAGGTVADRPMTTLVRGGPARTYALPRTTKIIGPHAFQDTDAPASVRLNDGLESLGESCFEYSGLERLVLPASVTSVGERAFTQCEHLKYVDLRAARGLRSLGRHAFYFCTELKQVLLNEGLEAICAGCFYQTGLETFVAPQYRGARLRRVSCPGTC